VTTATTSVLRCPECYEPAVRLPSPLPRTGWALAVEPKRLEHAHRDGEPLCPVMTATGYQPALPEAEPSLPTTATGALTPAQVSWAMAHDWFLCERNGAVTVLDCYTTADGVYVESERVFTSYSDLRAWAGY